MEPHRGTTLLVLGILSIVLCQFLGPVAWLMGNKDIQKMQAGSMDPDGLDTTKAGKICGIIGTILLILLVVMMIAIIALGGFAAAMGGAAGLEGMEGGLQPQ